MLSALKRLLLLVAVMMVAAIASPARADCQRSGDTVTCTGNDPDGFQAPSDALAVYVAPQGFVTNIDSGFFSGDCPLSPPAIDAGSGSSVVNEGIILGAGVCGWAVAVGNNSRVDNRGVILSNNRVGHGIIAGNAAVITSSGQITTLELGARGIFTGSGSSVTLTAPARITTGNAGGNAIVVGSLSIVASRGTLVTTGGVSHGIDAGSSSNLTNTGTIDVSGFGSFGMRARGGVNTIINAGELRAVLAGQSNAPGHGAGIEASGQTLTITNSGSITASYAGIRLSAPGTISVSNSGLVSASGERRMNGSFAPDGGGIVITSAPGGSVNITNTGDIRGHSGGPAIRIAGGNTTLRNSGAIAGDVSLGDNDDFVELSDQGTLSGTLDGGQGADFLSLKGNGNLTASIVNFENLLKLGPGTWTLRRDSSFASQVNVLDGTLRIDPGVRLSGPQLGILATGDLAGSGSVEGSVHNNGTLMPGGTDALGILGIAGAFTQTPTGILRVRLSPTGASDGLMIGGSATLNGILQIDYLPAVGAARFQTGQTFDLLIPGGIGFGMTGTFASIQNDATFLKPLLTERPGGGARIQIERIPYDTVAATKTQHAAASLLDRLQTAAALTPVLNALDFAGAAEARNTFDALAPESAPALQSLGLFTLASFHESFVAHHRRPSDGGIETWGQFVDRHGNGGKRSTAAHYRYGIQGVTAGLNYAVTTDASIGIAVGRSDGDARFSGTSGTSDLDASFISLTAGYALPDLRLAATLTYGNADSDIRRTQTIDGTSRMLTADSNADLWSVSADVTTSLQTGPITFTLKAGLTFAQISLGSLDEVQSLSLVTASSRIQSLKANVGVRAALEAGRFQPYVGVWSAVEILDNDRRVTAALNSVPGSTFTIAGASPRRVAIGTEAGVAFTMTPRLILHMEGRIIANDALAGRSINAGISWRW